MRHEMSLHRTPALAISLLLLALSGAAVAPAAEPAIEDPVLKLNRESFEQVWETVRTTYWDPELGGLDWQAVHDELLPRLEETASVSEARKVMNEMLARLEKTHFEVIPGDAYQALTTGGREGDGWTGLDLRVLGGLALVTRVEPGTPADEAGVVPGWTIEKVEGDDLAPILEKVDQTFRGSTLHDYYLAQAVRERLGGPQGSQVSVKFRDGQGKSKKLKLSLIAPKGQAVRFGNLPEHHVWFATRDLEGERFGYITFNVFLDPIRLMPAFGKAVGAFKGRDAIIIDLRGNPGGIGGMALGMAGWFIDTPGRKLGTMVTRQAPLRFVVVPRAETYDDPLAILVDGLSASTAEILAGGLQDLGRARIFGSRTAGAALPSLFTELPNGDTFQYAIADYTSEGGQHLEGNGVTPDEVVIPTRAQLIAGRDPVLEAALAWARNQVPSSTPTEAP
jgi:carboxyl-terminal processing protease